MYILIEVERGAGTEKISTRIVLEGDERPPGSVSDLREILMKASASLPRSASSVPVGVMPGQNKK